jgi:arsenate reductase (glutaredoxin)
MSRTILYHNPRCSKSRAALALLQERGIAPEIVRYLETPLDRRELETLRQRLGLPPREWVRRGEDAYREAGLSDQSSDDELLDAMVKHPVLMERPIFVRGERAAVGRPPERILDLL